MLFWAYSLKDLQFSGLMEVYAEANRENGRERYPAETEERQMALAEQEFYQYLRDTFFRTEGAAYALWQENGRYLSALRLEPYRDGLLLEALETAPGYRRKGYASALIRQVQEVLRNESNVKIYSHVSKNNTASLKTHFRCGFQIASDCAAYIDGSVSSRAYTLVYTLKKT